MTALFLPHGQRVRTALQLQGSCGAARQLKQKSWPQLQAASTAGGALAASIRPSLLPASEAINMQRPQPGRGHLSNNATFYSCHDVTLRQTKNAQGQ